MYRLNPGDELLVEIEGRHVPASVMEGMMQGYRLARIEVSLPYPSPYSEGSVVSVSAPYKRAPNGRLIVKPVARFV